MIPGKNLTATEVEKAMHDLQFPDGSGVSEHVMDEATQILGTTGIVRIQDGKIVPEEEVIVNEKSGSDSLGYYIRTFTGRKLYWDRIAEHDYNIEDIAHALSMKCRWSGHTSKFFSVAQHSVLVAALVPPEHQLNALLHDASETYMPDFPSPLKWYLRDLGFMVLSDIEKDVERAIAAKFKLQYPRPACIKVADLQLLATEHRDLMPHGEETAAMQDFLPNTLEPWAPGIAECRFLGMYERLTA